MADDKHYIGGVEPPWLPGDSCAIKGCDEPIRSMCFCAHHYDMWNRYGHPLAGVLSNHKARVRKTHDKERKAYHAMKTRCTNPRTKAWPGYGGRGITICQRWTESFANFLEDMGRAAPGLSLERLDVNGNYEPGNCKWGTPTEQARNTRWTRLTQEKVIEARRRSGGGETIADIAREYGVSYTCMYMAIVGRSWKKMVDAGHG
jgi:hypothetical protein